MTDPDALAGRLEQRFAEFSATVRRTLDEVTLEVDAAHLLAVCRALHDEEEFAFAQLVDLCGVDYLGFGDVEWETSEAATTGGFSRGVDRRLPEADAAAGPRFAVVYHLLSHRHNARLRLRVFAAGNPPRVDSVIEIWQGADWFEREAFDLFGILFKGHPDLRRLLTDYGFIGHPFRKDFPLIGEVEMRFDPDRGRVIYEPVSIEPRVLVPKVIRRDHRYAGDAPVKGANDA